MDTHLFVGDVAGLKKARAESKKIDSSNSGKHYLYLTGLKDRNADKDPGNGLSFTLLLTLPNLTKLKLPNLT